MLHSRDIQCSASLGAMQKWCLLGKGKAQDIRHVPCGAFHKVLRRAS